MFRDFLEEYLGILLISICIISCIVGGIVSYTNKVKIRVKDKDYYTRRYEDGKYIILEKTIEDVDNITILVDKETGIMYIDGKPMYNNNGHFKLYREE